jgi:hypothetical protein
MNKLFAPLTFLLCLLVSQHSQAQLVLEDPAYEIVSTFPVPAELTSELGTIMFSGDGNTVFVIDDSEDVGSAVSSAAVTRDAAGDVVSFGVFTEVFSYGELDTGLEYGPGSNTLFFKFYVSSDLGEDAIGAIGQRLPSGIIETTAVSGYDGEYGGLAFFPPGYANAGNLVTGAYDETYTLWTHSVTPDGDGSFTVNGAGTLYADFTSADEYYVSDLVFITRGPLAGNLMVALYDGNNSLVYFPIGADGLPVGGVDVTPTVFASGTTGAWGVAVDPVSDNIWMIDYDETGGVAMTQIGLRARTGPTPTNAIPTMSVYGLILSALCLVLLARPRISRQHKRR